METKDYSESRRDFIKKAALEGAGLVFWQLANILAEEGDRMNYVKQKDMRHLMNRE
jgi:hypothetical protein